MIRDLHEQNKVPAALSTPLPLTHEGFLGFLLVACYCKMFLLHCKNILQTIFSDHFEYIQYVLLPDKNVMDNI